MSGLLEFLGDEGPPKKRKKKRCVGGACKVKKPCANPSKCSCSSCKHKHMKKRKKRKH